ncbi:hypothetical protein ES703_47563 [subsurface metagenome]
MMTGVRSTEGGWTDNEYRYGGMASRVITLESGGFTYYDWDGINVIQERDEAASVTDRQVHGHAPITSVGDIAHMDKGGTVYVPTPDHVGTVWNLVDASAAKVNTYTYDAFGVARSTSETVSNKYRFGTKRLDPDPTLYHFIARQYGPQAGRSLSRGPNMRPNLYSQLDPNPFSARGGAAEPVGWVAGAKAVVKCALLYLGERFLDKIDSIDECQKLKAHWCIEAEDRTSWFKLNGDIEFGEASLGDFAKCVANELIGLGIFDDKPVVTTTVGAWMYWWCPEGVEQVHYEIYADVTAVAKGKKDGKEKIVRERRFIRYKKGFCVGSDKSIYMPCCAYTRHPKRPRVATL